tara:strand:+ start:1229 stop:1498 length:270 start_codon:yes stop_codon:yes gene_type:complete
MDINKKVDQIKNLYPRKCDNCNKGMNEGYCISDGIGYACSDKCLYVDGYTKKHFDEDYAMDCIYYSEWDELDEDVNYDINGKEVFNGVN